MDCGKSTEECNGTTRGLGSNALSSDKKQVDAQNPAFKKWFNKSQLVDNSGSPLVFYRGESGGEMYTEFDKRKSNSGMFFFATIRQHAESYTGRGGNERVREFYLSAKKVLDLRNIDYSDKKVMKFIKDFASNFKGEVDRTTGEELDMPSMIEGGYLYDLEGTGSGRAWNRMFRLAESYGYDGVIANDVTDGVNAPVVVVFEPNQIKSNQNCGNFDPNDNDIYH